MTLEELRDALARATGPDRELDLMIGSYIREGDFITEDRMGSFRAGYDALESVWPKYTASIDAAVTLVPSGFHWSLDDRSSGGFASAWIVKPGSRTREVLVRAKTPALAICLARVEYELQRAATPDGGRDK